MPEANHVILKIDPITRIEGHLGMFVKADSTSRKVLDAYTIAIMFRGFEIILKGRTPDSAIFITSRSCGVCGAAHANAAVLACDMALGVPPTPLGVCLRNLAYAMTDYTYDHSVLLCLLEGPDYSEVVVKNLTPSVWEKAKDVSCKYAGYHPYRTVADMMLGWNPVPKPGLTYALCVYMQRLAKEAGSLIYGKYPHPATLVPGGITFDLEHLEKIFTYYLPRLVALTLWVKTVVAQWRDMLEFYKLVEIETEEGKKTYTDYAGLTYEPAIMLSAGLFDYPFAEMFNNDKDYIPYDEIYAELVDEAYSARFHKPGFAVGELRETKFTDMQRRMVELATSAYYRHEPNYMSRYAEVDPAGKPLADGVTELIPYHEWNRETVPSPGALPRIPETWHGEKYSWCGEPRMVFREGRKALILPFEAGPIAKLWVHALYSHKPFDEKEFTQYSPVSLPFRLSAGGGKIVIEIPSYSDIVRAARDIVSEASSILGKSLPEITIPEALPLLSRDVAPDLYDSPLKIEWTNVRSTTLYRLYARAFSLACAVLAAWWSLALLLAVLKERGHKWHNKPGRPWKYPSYPPSALGVGWLEAPRGAVRHWIVIKNGRIANYQYHAPTTGNAAPRTIVEEIEKLGVDVKTPAEAGIRYATSADYEGLRGQKLSLISPYEAAALHCYMTEEVSPDKWTGLDIVRAIRSFDPCIGCAVHVELAGSCRKLSKYISPVAWSL